MNKDTHFLVRTTMFFAIVMFRFWGHGTAIIGFGEQKELYINSTLTRKQR